jgi:tetratricopeptide (TPR) repeat protein
VTERREGVIPFSLRTGVIVVQPLILQYYQLLPEQPQDEETVDSARVYRKALSRFRRAVEARYSEATLERLLCAPCAEVRQATLLAMRLLGSIQANAAVAARLHDEDPTVRELAADALWSIWQRGDTPEHNKDLQRLVQRIAAEEDAAEILAGFDALIRKAPRFAEAYNQRAVFHYHRGDYAKAITDCEKTLRLNPYHYGAASGMGQCFMKQKKLRAALRVYRRAARINPNLESVRDTILSLERMLGEEGKR